jgi:hypothetical protein
VCTRPATLAILLRWSVWRRERAGDDSCGVRAADPSKPIEVTKRTWPRPSTLPAALAPVGAAEAAGAATGADAAAGISTGVSMDKGGDSSGSPTTSPTGTIGGPGTPTFGAPHLEALVAIV